MAIIDEIIRIEQDGSISFGNYEVETKQKVEDFKVGDDIYKVRTHKDVTRLSKNGTLVLETVPGATIHSLNVSNKGVSFNAEGFASTMITLELEQDTNYSIYINDVNIDKTKANLSGKVSFSLDLDSNKQSVKIEK